LRQALLSKTFWDAGDLGAVGGNYYRPCEINVLNTLNYQNVIRINYLRYFSTANGVLRVYTFPSK